MIIDTSNLETLEIQELALLLLLYNSATDCSKKLSPVSEEDIKNVFKGLCKKGYVTDVVYSSDNNYNPPYQITSWCLLEQGKIALADNCTPSKKKTSKISTKELVSRCDSLADKLMELYPLGKKPGTNLQWRGYRKGISEKLQKLLLNGNTFTDEEAVEATKAYVNSFNGIYTQMRILPYFLSKNEIVGGELKKTCDFMTYVEDLRNNPFGVTINRDWDIRLC